jgi:acyl carrier protein
MADTLERIRKVTAELLKIEQGKITPTSRFVQDLGADSVQSLELVAAFEEEFDIEMNEDDALAVKNVGDAVGFIDKVLRRK